MLCATSLTLSATAQSVVVSVTPDKSHQIANTTGYEVAGKIGDADAGQTWSTYGFNMNNGSWTTDGYIRCGSKSKAVTATITSDFAMSQEINKVSVDVTRVKTAQTTLRLQSACWYLRAQICPTQSLTNAAPANLPPTML